MTARGLIHVVRSTVGISLGVALFGLANGGLFAMIGVRLSAEGAADTTVGLVTSTYFLGTLTASLTVGRLVARIGHVTAFALFALIAGGSTLALLPAGGETLWSILRYLTGIGIGGYYIVVESWFNHATHNDSRGRAMAYYETVRLGSVAAGSLVFLNIGSVTTVDAFAIAAVLYVAAIAPVFVQRATRPRIETYRRLPLSIMLARAPLGMWCCFAGGLTTGAIYGLVPLYGVMQGLGVFEVSILVFANHFAAVVVQFPAGIVSDRVGRSRTILGLAALLCAAALTVALDGAPRFVHLLAASMLVGGVSHTLNTMGVVFANDWLDPADYVHGAATLLVAYDIGSSVGPLGASLAMAALGASGLYWFMAGLGAVTAVFAVVEGRLSALRADL